MKRNFTFRSFYRAAIAAFLLLLLNSTASAQCPPGDVTLLTEA